MTYHQTKHTFYTTKLGEQRLWGHEQRERTPVTVCYASDPDSYASATFLGGIADEVGQKGFTREAWDTLRSRMMTTVRRRARNNPPHLAHLGCGRVWAGSTIYTFNWFVDELLDWKKVWIAARRQIVEQMRLEPDPLKRHEMLEEHRDREYFGLIDSERHFIRFDSTANQTIPQEEIDQLRKKWTKWYFDMRIRAIPTRPAGVIYEEFDPQNHVISRENPPDEWKDVRGGIPANWRRVGAIDFGKKNFYATVWAQDPVEDRWLCYAAYHRPDLSTEQHGAKIGELFPEVTEWVAGQVSEDEAREQLAAGGLATMHPPFKDLWLGINNFASAIKLDKVFLFDDLRPAQISTEKAVNFAAAIEKEVQNYSRPVNKETGVVDLDADPVDKEKQHWCDTLRYFGTIVFAGLGKATVVAASKRGHESETAVVAHSREKETSLSDFVLAGTGDESRFTDRFGGYLDPLF